MNNLTVKELFVNFYETKNDYSEALYYIVKNTLIRFKFDLSNSGGQC